MNDSKVSLFLPVVLVLVGILWWSPWKKQELTEPSPSVEVETTANTEGANTLPETPKEEVAVAEPTEPLVETKKKQQENFVEALKGIGTCLDIRNTIDSDEQDPKIEFLISSLRSEWGEPTVKTEDWSNTNLTLPNGEERRIRLEIDFDSADRIVKRLKYFSLDKDKMPVPLDLPPEQVFDPSEEFLASLESEGQVTLKQKSLRYYFQDGEEIILIERNGLISDLEVNKDGRYFKCKGLDSQQLSCQCL